MPYRVEGCLEIQGDQSRKLLSVEYVADIRMKSSESVDGGVLSQKAKLVAKDVQGVDM